jgi:hypothetical protein
VGARPAVMARVAGCWLSVIDTTLRVAVLPFLPGSSEANWLLLSGHDDRSGSCLPCSAAANR